ncbi:MAG: hypothetical protein RRC34_10265 [Lentisphaeria bacterium]|nr:hypothetical protein [Lentisphaeria bacterium]
MPQNMTTDLYPLVFRPVLVPHSWAGSFMGDFLAATYGELSESPGEAWLLFDDGQRGSVVANGAFAQVPLTDLVRSRPDKLVGRHHVSRNPFPFSIRLIDTAEDQPVQVHPETLSSNDSNAKFWYSLAARPGAQIIDGIAQQVTNQQLLANLNKPAFNRLLQHYPGRPGDSYLIPPGFIHSLGAGNMILEIQQRYEQPLVLASEPTSGARENQQAALDALNWEARTNMRISREAGVTNHTRRVNLTANCPYFTVEEIRLKDHIFLRADETSFNVIILIKGHAVLKWSAVTIDLKPGMLCCVPAACGDYKIETVETRSELLRVKTI